MIDWYNLAGNSLWILACALGLAVFSYASWDASIHKARLREQLSKPAYQVVLNVSGILFCSGLAITSGRTWEAYLWAGLAVLFLISIAVEVRGFIQI